MTDLPRSMPILGSCSCPKCRDRRVPVQVCEVWLRLTADLHLPPDTPFETIRFRCGKTVVITWGEIALIRDRLGGTGRAA